MKPVNPPLSVWAKSESESEEHTEHVGRAESTGSQMDFNGVIEKIGMTIDGVGVAVIVIGAAYAFALAAMRLSGMMAQCLPRVSQQLGQVILLGLELLVAGDTVKTVAAQPTLTRVAILGGIVIIRTFLSFSLEVEVDGRWPWQKRTSLPPTDRG